MTIATQIHFHFLNGSSHTQKNKLPITQVQGTTGRWASPSRVMLILPYQALNNDA